MRNPYGWYPKRKTPKPPKIAAPGERFAYIGILPDSHLSAIRRAQRLLQRCATLFEWEHLREIDRRNARKCHAVADELEAIQAKYDPFYWPTPDDSTASTPTPPVRDTGRKGS